MSKRSWRRRRNFPDANGSRVGRGTLAIAVVALLGAIVLGVQLGNSAIADIHPVHRAGAAGPSPGRSAAEIERRARSRESAYASLYGWDEGRAARGETCDDCLPPAEPDIQVLSEPPPLYEADEAPLPASGPGFSVSITEGKDGVTGYEHDPAEGEGD